MTGLFGSRLIFLDEVSSTNNYANGCLSQEEELHGVVIRARSQVKGRGQINNSWESEPGANLTFSAILIPDFIEIHHQFLLSKVISLAVVDALLDFGIEASIKWPNDIYWNDKKIAGILIENALMGACISSSVVGVGLNINQLEFLSDAPNPVSMTQILGGKLNIESVYRTLIHHFEKYYTILSQGHIDTINKSYHQVMFRLNIISDYRDKMGFFRGEIIGVNEIGQLIVRKNNEEIFTYHFKEIEFIHK